MPIINDRYEFDPKTDELGQGGFGRVFKAKDHLLDRHVVLKYAEKGNLPEKYSLVKEIGRVIDFNHPNLVRYYDAIVKKSTNSFGEEVEHHIGIMEYVKDGNLRTYLKNGTNPDEIHQIIEGILNGLDYLHKRNLIHRDIKPPNILLDRQGENIIPKICDFGISKITGGESTALSNVIGTFEYMSPEQLGNNSRQKIKTNSDLWSLGVMLYEIFANDLPFGSRRSGTTDAKIINNILNHQELGDLSFIPPIYREMVQRCLVKDPDSRIDNAQDLLEILKNPPSNPRSLLDSGSRGLGIIETPDDSINQSRSLDPQPEQELRTRGIPTDRSLGSGSSNISEPEEEQNQEKEPISLVRSRGSFLNPTEEEENLKEDDIASYPITNSGVPEEAEKKWHFPLIAWLVASPILMFLLGAFLDDNDITIGDGDGMSLGLFLSGIVAFFAGRKIKEAHIESERGGYPAWYWAGFSALGEFIFLGLYVTIFYEGLGLAPGMIAIFSGLIFLFYKHEKLSKKAIHWVGIIMALPPGFLLLGGLLDGIRALPAFLIVNSLQLVLLYLLITRLRDRKEVNLLLWLGNIVLTGIYGVLVQIFVIAYCSSLPCMVTEAATDTIFTLAGVIWIFSAYRKKN